MSYLILTTSLKLFVGNKAKGQISKRVLQETKARQISKNEHFLPPDMHTHISGDKKCLLFGKLGVVCFLLTPNLRFPFSPYYKRNIVSVSQFY